VSDELDWGEAADYILGQRPELEQEDVWAVLKELGDPPTRDQERLALDLIAHAAAGVTTRDARTILSEWRAYANLAAEHDWDD